MKLNIGNGRVRDEGDIEAFNLYDDAAIDEARHELRAKVIRQRRKGGDGGRDGSRASRSMRRLDNGGRHGR
jgi:hypothetical protein